MPSTGTTEKRGTSPRASNPKRRSTPVPEPSLSPYRQGGLDALCGLYAIINAMRRCLGEAYDEIWPDVFEALLLSTEREVGLAEALTLGIRTKPFRAILQYATWTMAEQYGLAFSSTQMSDAPPRLALDISAPTSADEYARIVRAWTSRPQAAVLIGIKRRHRPLHWTVIERVTRRRLLLLDSAGIDQIRRKDCRIAKAKGAGNLGHDACRLSPKRTFLIELETGKRLD
jgi:hypothetical protein